MRDNKKDLRKRIQGVKEKSKFAEPTSSHGEEQFEEEITNKVFQQEQAEHFVDPVEKQEDFPKTKGQFFSERKLKGMKRFGYIAIAIGIISMFLTDTATVDTSESAKSALENQVSTAITAGVILLKEDENLGAQDYTITHSSDVDETKIWVWDYAAEDGDYVQVLVNGVPISESFMIQHKPKEMMVPSTGAVQIKGIKDGGGGITYAVRYDINGTSYFNTAPEGEFNTYELIRQ